MQQRRARRGVLLYLGTIQYGLFLSLGGAGWFLAARLTGFFWSDTPLQVASCLVLLALVVAESLWAYMPGFGNAVREFAVDLLTSAGIAAFGMIVVAFVLAWLRL